MAAAALTPDDHLSPHHPAIERDVDYQHHFEFLRRRLRPNHQLKLVQLSVLSPVVKQLEVQPAGEVIRSCDHLDLDLCQHSPDFFCWYHRPRHIPVPTAGRRPADPHQLFYARPFFLVGMHASSPIPGPAISRSSSTANLLVGFAGAVGMVKALMGPPPPRSLHDPKEKKGGVLSPGSSQHHSSQQQQHQLRIPTHFTLTALPRHDPALYVQPYWESWVRALCVVWRNEIPLPLPGEEAGCGGVVPSSSSGAAAGGFGIGAGATVWRAWGWDDGHGYGGWVKTKLEWRKRWVVIRDRVINLCKTGELTIQTDAKYFEVRPKIT
ncbi:hypothetical protein GALMADRAFT_217458 [Galerina marginata CBS 339.88]|uniref:Uncharacterized protein n=1 Tax=Galerina marginata (strain CBS 339.88) TaxID=685588 RepID=A0A067S4D3_GALM3|nr:hypothetical protein GALMADRAFT_217458 [Galerina marginata CBS 339.88]